MSEFNKEPLAQPPLPPHEHGDNSDYSTLLEVHNLLRDQQLARRAIEKTNNMPIFISESDNTITVEDPETGKPKEVNFFKEFISQELAEHATAELEEYEELDPDLVGNVRTWVNDPENNIPEKVAVKASKNKNVANSKTPEIKIDQTVLDDLNFPLKGFTEMQVGSERSDMRSRKGNAQVRPDGFHWSLIDNFYNHYVRRQEKQYKSAEDIAVCSTFAHTVAAAMVKFGNAEAMRGTLNDYLEHETVQKALIPEMAVNGGRNQDNNEIHKFFRDMMKGVSNEYNLDAALNKFSRKRFTAAPSTITEDVKEGFDSRVTDSQNPDMEYYVDAKAHGAFTGLIEKGKDDAFLIGQGIAIKKVGTKQIIVIDVNEIGGLKTPTAQSKVELLFESERPRDITRAVAEAIEWLNTNTKDPQAV